jgi:hypothetical protein
MTALAFSLTHLAGTPNPASAATSAYTAVLSNNASCQFALVARWPAAAHVATVYAQWYVNGTSPAPTGTFLFTTQAPGTGPGAGTIAHRSATFTAGPLYPSSAAYPWYVLVQYYTAAGTRLAAIYSDVNTTACASQPGL